MKTRHAILSIVLTILCVAGAHAQGQRQGRGSGPAAPNTNAGSDVQALLAPPLVWWTDAALLAELGITDVQKAKIQNAFDTHRENLMSAIESIEKEETQLKGLLEREPLDRPAVLSQINRVIQARADMTRISSTMALEIREQLTRTQWTQLQAKTRLTLQVSGAGARGRGTTGTPGVSALQGVPGTVRVGGQVAAANLVSSPAAQYPPLARAARIEGVVVLEVVIDKTGNVTSIAVVSGHALLNDAAVQAVRQWRYRPMMMNGQPVDVVTTVSVNFSLQ